jgi:hypothetical protein
MVDSGVSVTMVGAEPGIIRILRVGIVSVSIWKEECM